MVSYDVVDVDAHIHDDLELLVEYFDEPWRSEILTDASEMNQAIALNSLLPGNSGDRFRGGRIEYDPFDSQSGEYMGPESIPVFMDKLGLNDVLLLSNQLLAFPRMSADDRRASMLAEAYLNYMIDHVVEPAAGIYSMVVVPYQDPDKSAELIEQSSDEDGIVAVCFITAGVEPPLGNRKYDPIYEAAQDAGLPVVFHAGGSNLDDFHIKGYEKFIETHTLGFLNANLSQITSVVVQGVPEKFPNLDIIFQECGVFYIPAIMERLDTEYLKRPSEAPLLEQRPSKYMKEFYYGTQPLETPENETHMEYVFEMIDGVDTLMFASDYAHWDFDHPRAITNLSFLSRGEKKQILASNAREVFGI